MSQGYVRLSKLLLCTLKIAQWNAIYQVRDHCLPGQPCLHSALPHLDWEGSFTTRCPVSSSSEMSSNEYDLWAGVRLPLWPGVVRPDLEWWISSSNAATVQEKVCVLEHTLHNAKEIYC